MTPKLMLSLDEVASALSVSISTVQGLIRSGEFPKQRRISRGRVGWLWREVEEWAESRPVADMLPPPNTGARKGRRAVAEGAEGGVA